MRNLCLILSVLLFTCCSDNDNDKDPTLLFTLVSEDGKSVIEVYNDDTAYIKNDNADVPALIERHQDTGHIIIYEDRLMNGFFMGRVSISFEYDGVDFPDSFIAYEKYLIGGDVIDFEISRDYRKVFPN